MPRLLALPVILILSAVVLAGCGSGTTGVAGVADPAPEQAASAPPVQPAGLPAALPVDIVQPWESVDGSGNVVPASAGARGASALSADSEFVAGIERFSEGGSATDIGEATELASGAGGLSYAIYRIPLGGAEPGVVSIDANMLDGDGYYVGLADYAADAWDWHGPFGDSHTRLSVAGPGPAADFTSALGSTFVCVAAYDGAACDVVGVSVDVADGADTEAPPAPAAPQATALTGALLLDWLPVAAGDLAGYRIYHSAQWFFDGLGAGVRTVDGLEGLTSYVLVSSSAETFVRISAVDISGNESPLSDIVSLEVAPAVQPPLRVLVTAPSGALNQPLTITASGADTYDIDTDGDGIFDITGDATGVAAVDTSSLGILRPRVRGSSGSGSLVALGGVSVVIAGNSRPVASAVAVPSVGIAPLLVSLTGGDSMDFDGEIVGGGWDFNGDGSYDVWDDAGTDFVEAAQNTYTLPGIYNAKLRVVDNDGAWDVDTVAILVTPDPNPANNPPTAALTADRRHTYAPFIIKFDAAGSADSDGSVVLYEWDFNGDGTFEAAGPSPQATHVYPVRGWYTVTVRVTDDSGAQATAALTIGLPTAWAGYSRTLGNTGQSPYTGAQTSDTKWTFPLGSAIFCSPALAVDGTIYIGNGGGGGALYAMNPNGTVKWSYPIANAVNSSPAIADDGTIYFGGYDQNFYALNPNGGLRWSVATDGQMIGGACIAPDGVIFVGTRSGTLYSFFPDGSTRWSYPTGGEIWSTPAVDADGTVYFTTSSLGFFAVNSDGSLRWNDTSVGPMRSSPAVGPDGRIYFGDDGNMFYSYSSDGTQNWALPVTGTVFGAPSFGADGNIYVPCQSATDGLYSVTPAGEVNWTFNAAGSVSVAPAIGADGVIYISTLAGNFFAVNPEGSQLWTLASGAGFCESSAAIAPDGTVYFADSNGDLYAFGVTP